MSNSLAPVAMVQGQAAACLRINITGIACDIICLHCVSDQGGEHVVAFVGTIFVQYTGENPIGFPVNNTVETGHCFTWWFAYCYHYRGR